MKMDFAATVNIFGVDTKGWMEFSQVKETQAPYTPHGLCRFVDVEGQIWEGMTYGTNLSARILENNLYRIGSTAIGR